MEFKYNEETFEIRKPSFEDRKEADFIYTKIFNKLLPDCLTRKETIDILYKRGALDNEDINDCPELHSKINILATKGKTEKEKAKVDKEREALEKELNKKIEKKVELLSNCVEEQAGNKRLDALLAFSIYKDNKRYYKTLDDFYQEDDQKFVLGAFQRLLNVFIEVPQ